MNSLVIFIIFTQLIISVVPFNLETRLPIIKRGRPGSYFGYSVAEHQSVDEVTERIRQNWLLVGAPLDQNLQPGTNRSGALWACPISTKSDDCKQVVTDGKRNAGGGYGYSVDSTDLMPPLPDEIKDGQWMGVTVKSQKPGGKVLVCAHRYVRNGTDFQWGQGLCYTLSQDLDYDETWEPCKGRSIAKAHEEYGYCQAGTSGMLLEDDTAVIGTPGLYTWRGTVFVISISDDYLYRDKTHYYGPHFENNSPVEKYSYLGMSATGGKFFSSSDMSYAAGAPRANGTGQVILFAKERRENPMHVRAVINGEQFASNFGYEIAAADLNGDGLPDLIVAAPFYFSRDAGGAVYIYYNKDYCLTCQPPQKLTGALESRFGFAMSSLGDLNADGFHDLAIGAPYEQDGVVYIHLGSEGGLIKEPSQVIKAGHFNGFPKTFGYSLSGKLDLDENGYPDLLIGAYESDAIVFLRSRPIIDILTEISPLSALKNIDPSKKGCDRDPNSEFACITFKTCCNVLKNSSLHSADSLAVYYKIESETFLTNRKFSRLWFGSDNITRPSFRAESIILTRQTSGDNLRHCQSHIVYLKESVKDIQSPIKLKLDYTLLQNPPEQPKPGDPLPSLDQFPILNKKEAAKIFEITFNKDCGDDDVCQSDLKTSVVLDLPDGEEESQWILKLGASDAVPINVTIENRGESAYETQFYVFHPAVVAYNRIESESKQVSCHPFNSTVVMCNVGNPLKTNSVVKFQVKFDAKKIDDSQAELNFLVFTNSTSYEITPEEPQTLGAYVVKQAELSLRGSRPEQVFYGGMVRGESAMVFKDEIGTKVVHKYEVYNAGPWKVRDLEIQIMWPYQVANTKPQGKWLLYLDENPTVEAIGGGKCYVPNNVINPLHLEPRPGLFESSTENSFDIENETRSYLSDFSHSTRNKRDVGVKIRSERVVDIDGRVQTIVNMNCVNGSAKCIPLRCVIHSINAGQEALVRVSARLWNATLVEDYGGRRSGIDYVVIASNAQLMLTGSFIQNDRRDDLATCLTLAYPESRHDGIDADAVPLWIIIVAAVAGILLLLLIVLVLWKIGFFKRHRPDPTLSGNLHKASNSD